MKILLIFGCAAMLFLSKACDKTSNAADSDKSDNANCLAEKMDDFKSRNASRGATSIFTFASNGKTYTVFDEGLAFDAQAYVLNNDCDTVHVYGGMVAPDPNAPKEEPPFKWEDMEKRTQVWPEG